MWWTNGNQEGEKNFKEQWILGKEEKSLNTSRDEERLEEAKNVERSRIKRKINKDEREEKIIGGNTETGETSKQKEQEMDKISVDEIENNEGCGNCRTKTLLIDCDICGNWLCRRCSELKYVNKLRVVAEETLRHKDLGICWMCPRCKEKIEKGKIEGTKEETEVKGKAGEKEREKNREKEELREMNERLINQEAEGMAKIDKMMKECDITKQEGENKRREMEDKMEKWS